MITINLLHGYWTVCVDGKPQVSFASLDAAHTAVPEGEIQFEIELRRMAS